MRTKKGKKQKLLGNKKKRIFYDENLNEDEDLNYNEDSGEIEEVEEENKSNISAENENSLNDENSESGNINKIIELKDTKFNQNDVTVEKEQISIELKTSRNIVKQQEIYYSFIGLRILFQDILNISVNLPDKSNIEKNQINPKIVDNLELTLLETENNMDKLLQAMVNKINKPLLSEKGIESSSGKPNSKFIKKYSNKIIDSWYKKTINSLNSNVGSLTQNLEDGLHNYYLNYIKKSTYRLQITDSKLQDEKKNELIKQRYDDSDFYDILLKDFINFNSSLNLENIDDANEVDNILQQETLLRLKNQKDRKSKICSSKLSKNRAINYQIHEKIKNFIAPEDYNDNFNGRKEILSKLFSIKWSDIIENKENQTNKTLTGENSKLDEHKIYKESKNDESLIKSSDNSNLLKKISKKNKNVVNSKSKFSEIVIDSDNDNDDVKLL